MYLVVSRGLSRRQRLILDVLGAADRPLHVTGELGPAIGMPRTPAGTRSLISAVRSLERRGQAAVTTEPRPGGGQPLLYAAARNGAVEVTGADVQHGGTTAAANHRKVTDTPRQTRTRCDPDDLYERLALPPALLELQAETLRLIPADWECRAYISNGFNDTDVDGTLTVLAVLDVVRWRTVDGVRAGDGIATAYWQMHARPVAIGGRTEYELDPWRVAPGATGARPGPTHFRRRLKVALMKERAGGVEPEA